MTDDDATIHLRVPAALKARWALESRAAGRRLTDWIIERVEAKMHQTILIPADLAFADLRLARNPDGRDADRAREYQRQYRADRAKK